MILKIFVLIIALLAITINFNSKNLAEKVFNKNVEDEDFNITQGKIKIASFILGVIAFILAIILVR